VWASDGTVRLCGDTKRHFAASADSVRRESDGKFVVTRSALQSVDTGYTSQSKRDGRDIENPESRTRLGAIYVLTPVRGPDAAVIRRAIAPSAGVALLIRHLKLGALVSPDYPARKMEHLGAIVRGVPVFELTVPRDWSRIGEVVSHILGWHQPNDVALTTDQRTRVAR
jgi:hypothetical protein